MPHTAALCARNLSSGWTSDPSSGWSSVSGLEPEPRCRAEVRHRDARLVDRGRGGDVELEQRRDVRRSRRLRGPGVGIEALEVGEAPVLVARRRERQRLVALEELSSHEACTGGGASGRSRPGRGRTPCGTRPCRTCPRRTRSPSPRARRVQSRRRRHAARGAQSSAARTPARRWWARRCRSTGRRPRTPRPPSRRAEPERVDVEGARALPVGRRHGDEIGLPDLHGVLPGPPGYPTEPSIWNWISRFISTAYSSGSSFVIGSTKPETIIALASASREPAAT